MESIAVVFFLEKSQYFLPGRTLFRQGATAPKSWQVPPVITGGVGEDTHIKPELFMHILNCICKWLCMIRQLQSCQPV